MSARRLSARALWGLASWALPLAVIFLVTPSLLRLLGAERFGMLMICFVTPLLAVQLDCGLTALAVRRFSSLLAGGTVDAARTLVTFVGALSVIGVALGALVWVTADAIGESLGFAATLGETAAGELVRWCAVWITASLVTVIPGVLARSAQSFVLITAIQTVGSALLWGGALTIARSARPMHEVVALGIALSVGSAVITTLAVRGRIDWQGPWRFDGSILRDGARFSAGMFASQLASAVVYQGDRILVSAVASPAVAGIYALCANVANKALAAVVALTSFAFPHATGLHAAGGRERITEFNDALERGVIAIVAPLLLPGVLLAAPFFRLWLGEQGTPEVVTVFRILWIAFCIPAVSIPVSTIVAAYGRAGLPARFATLTAIVVVIAIALLVPRWGASGAAVAMLLGLGTSLLFRAVARRSLALRAPVGRLKFLIGIAVGLAGQLLVLLLGMHSSTWLQWIVSASAALTVFYAVRAIFGLLSPEEKQLLNRLTAGRPRADSP